MRSVAVVVTGVLVWLLPAAVRGWGMDVHRHLTRRAVDGLPAEIRPHFATHREFIGEHSADPDLWRIVGLKTALGDEDPNHFLDIDALGESAPFSGVPREWAAFVARYGEARATRAGRLPWRIEDIYTRLVTAFRDAGRGSFYGLDNARYLMAVIAHYVQDGHQPFHAIENYDGQLTGQRGVHARFETQLVLRNLSRLRFRPVTVKPIGPIRDYAFGVVIESEALAGGVLAADLAARRGREEYDDEYFRLFFDAARDVLERRLSDAVDATASVVVAAWIEAGRPDLSRREPRVDPLRLRH